VLDFRPQPQDLHTQVQQAEDTSGDDSEWESASDEEDSVAAAAGAGGDTPEAADSTAGQADADMTDSSEWAEWDVRRRCGVGMPCQNSTTCIDRVLCHWCPLPSGARSCTKIGAFFCSVSTPTTPTRTDSTWACVCSLFDNHASPSFEANLDYMFRNFGFYFPDAEYLTDPEGLLKYLVSCCIFPHAKDLISRGSLRVVGELLLLPGRRVPHRPRGAA
jgi:C2H2 type zinc-finger (2 copies)